MERLGGQSISNRRPIIPPICRVRPGSESFSEPRLEVEERGI